MNIEDFKDKYLGKRIFIIGNGPSLKETPLHLLEGEYSFAMNRIALLYEKTTWRPTFFLCVTKNVRYEEWRKDILTSLNLGIPSFVCSELSSFFNENYSNIFKVNCTHGPEIRDEVPDDWWSFDITDYVSKFGTSMLAALQIAVYMGFSEIYLLGADLGFKNYKNNRFSNFQLKYVNPIKKHLGIPIFLSDKNHFSTTYGTPGREHNILNKTMLAAHRLTKRICDKKGVDIYNSTLGGALEIYERKSIFEIFKIDS